MREIYIYIYKQKSKEISYSRSVWLQRISLIYNRHLNQLLSGLNNYTRNRPKLHLKPTKSYWFSLNRSVLVGIGLAWTPLHFLIPFPFILPSYWQQDLIPVWIGLLWVCVGFFFFFFFLGEVHFCGSCVLFTGLTNLFFQQNFH